jgi:hypothetical protein
MNRLLAIFFSAVALSSCAVRNEALPASSGPIEAGLRMQSADFALAGQREIKAVYSVRNVGKQPLRLDFPTAQHLELILRSPEQRPLFLWSEDRLFASVPSVVVINPGERLEYEASVPTRDMVAGASYEVEAMLVGYPKSRSFSELRPR